MKSKARVGERNKHNCFYTSSSDFSLVKFIHTKSRTRMWGMSGRSQIVYFGTDLRGLSHSFVFPWKHI